MAKTTYHINNSYTLFAKLISLLTTLVNVRNIYLLQRKLNSIL